jgi:hypothetical protein
MEEDNCEVEGTRISGVAHAEAKRFGGSHLRLAPKLIAGLPHETDSSASFRGLPHTTGSAGGC